MKKLILTLILFLSLIPSAFAYSYSGSCGIKPLKPLNCMNGYAVCQCNGYQCSWMFGGC